MFKIEFSRVCVKRNRVSKLFNIEMNRKIYSAIKVHASYEVLEEVDNEKFKSLGFYETYELLEEIKKIEKEDPKLYEEYAQQISEFLRDEVEPVWTCCEYKEINCVFECRTDCKVDVYCKQECDCHQP